MQRRTAVGRQVAAARIARPARLPMRCDSSVMRFIGATAAFLAIPNASLVAQQPSASKPPGHTQVVLLGTGNPAIDPDRSGPATAIVVNGTAYLVDIGVGVVRRAKEAAVERAISALEPTKLRVVFVTHLHSDHTVGYPDLILTPWVVGRQEPTRGIRAARNQSDGGAHPRSL